MNSLSQAKQDLFVMYVMNFKKDGYFVEIGSNEPIYVNNTYILENEYNWRGLLVEYHPMFEKGYIEHRKKSIYRIQDARSVDYLKIMDDNNFPVNMDYLQIDLEAENRSTLDVLNLLNNTVFDKYKFATITFEHDIYTGDHHDTINLSRKIFKDRGYILVFPKVSVFYIGEWREHEDWYVHPDLVDMDYVNKIKSDVSLTCDEIAQVLYNSRLQVP